MFIHKYLPEALLPKEDFEEWTWDQFLTTYAQADCARDLSIEDLAAGIGLALNEEE